MYPLLNLYDRTVWMPVPVFVPIARRIPSFRNELLRPFCFLRRWDSRSMWRSRRLNARYNTVWWSSRAGATPAARGRTPNIRVAQRALNIHFDTAFHMLYFNSAFLERFMILRVIQVDLYLFIFRILVFELFVYSTVLTLPYNQFFAFLKTKLKLILLYSFSQYIRTLETLCTNL